MSTSSIDTVLTTSNINSLVNSFINDQTYRMVTPISTRKSKYQGLSSAYSTFNSKLNSLQTLLSNFKTTDSSSLFNNKTAVSSNSTFLATTVDNSSSIGSYSMRVSQLAKNDVLLSQDLASSTANSITGTHTFTINTGDGSNSDFKSNVDVTFSGTETNQSLMEKIRDAINSDKAVVQSNTKNASDMYTGEPTTFTIDLNGSETTISVDGGGTYGDLIDEIVSKVNSTVTGVSAEKVSDSPNPGDVSLKLSVTDSKNYISITNTGSFDVVSDLNIGAAKEKGASGVVSASAFSPASGTTQFSLTSKQTGVDYRIKSLSDSVGSTALSAIGLNLGSNRPSFDQTQDPDTAGYLYAETSSNSQLNSQINFNGLTISRNSNVINDLVTGVTFNLKSAMESSDADVSVTVSNDVKKIESNVQNFITKFNDIYQYLKANSSGGSSSSAGGALAYDSNASSLLGILRSVAYTNISGLPSGSLNSLSQIGISFDAANGLSISDTAKFEQQVGEKADQVSALFNSTNGVANTLYDKINPFLGVSGYLSLKQNTYNSNVRTLNDKITSAQDRINKSANSLRTQYEQLQAQLADMISMQNMINLL